MNASQAFVRACALDVLVRKPGNVSVDSPGHGMQAAQFLAAAQAAAGPLFVPGARVGQRIESAVAASLAAAGCNTNLGIVLLCAPLAAAAERVGTATSPAVLRAALEAVLAELDLDDARAAYRAIAAARPGGLGSAPQQDVFDAPTWGLRAAMALAADRDSIARQYKNGFAQLFETGLPLCAAGVNAAVVQRVFLSYLSRWPDSHIVRKHGAGLAHIVMSAAQRFAGAADPASAPGFVAWDEALKAQGLNPGTSADLTVATLMPALWWHGT